MSAGFFMPHCFHLGTIESVARVVARGDYTCTVALIRDGSILAVYDGAWIS